MLAAGPCPLSTCPEWQVAAQLRLMVDDDEGQAVGRCGSLRCRRPTVVRSYLLCPDEGLHMDGRKPSPFPCARAQKTGTTLAGCSRRVYNTWCPACLCEDHAKRSVPIKGVRACGVLMIAESPIGDLPTAENECLISRCLRLPDVRTLNKPYTFLVFIWERLSIHKPAIPSAGLR